MEVLLENAQSLLQGDGWKLIVMWLIGAVLIYLAIAKDMEPRCCCRSASARS